MTLHPVIRLKEVLELKKHPLGGWDGDQLPLPLISLPSVNQFVLCKTVAGDGRETIALMKTSRGHSDITVSDASHNGGKR